VYSDASKVFGAGGTFGCEVFSKPWSQNRHDTHIGVLELEAFYEALSHWQDQLTGQLVLGRMDNIQAVIAVNKGSSKIPAMRKLLRQIADLGLKAGFEVKAKYIKGELNPADAPSRGQQVSTMAHLSFRYFSKHNNPAAIVDCCAAEDGHNVQPGCQEWYSAERPVQAHTHKLVGKAVWACPPHTLVGEVLTTIKAAWQQDPRGTCATVVVPDWPTAPWYRIFLRVKNPLFRVVHRYPAGTRLYQDSRTGIIAGPAAHPTLVIRTQSGKL
jgi:hypothetical protein